MIEQGWIKLHRKMLDNPVVWKDSDHLSVWIYLLLNATHKDMDVLFKSKRITLKPGQLITGRKSIASQLSISDSKVKRVLLAFESDQQIDRQRSNQNRLITILNWCEYQQNDQQNDQQVTSKRPASDQQVTTNKNVKNDKNERMKENIYSDYTENPNLLKALKDFEIMRNSMKNGKFTDQAKKLLLTELNKLADTDEKKIAILEQSIFNGWKGVFPLKQGQAQKNGFDNFEKRTYDTASLKEKLLKKGRGEL